MAHDDFSHLDGAQRPTMVDVGDKAISQRRAVAEATVRFPVDVAERMRADGLRGPKGPIIDTAIIAGTLAVKRTHELIPFCHPLPVERCRFEIDFVNATDLLIRCEVGVSHKTGVEMEALTGASIAALTVYDMCKALSHAIVISNLRLTDKSGGKRDIHDGEEAM